jgi:hypothetical protein
MPIDLSKATREELLAIHNEVLKHVAEQTKADLSSDVRAAGHDSHGSNHSNNKITDIQERIAEVFRRQR